MRKLGLGLLVALAPACKSGAGWSNEDALAATFPPEVTPPDGWQVIGTVAAGAAQVLVDGRPYSGSGGWDHFAR